MIALALTWLLGAASAQEVAPMPVDELLGGVGAERTLRVDDSSLERTALVRVAAAWGYRPFVPGDDTADLGAVDHAGTLLFGGSATLWRLRLGAQATARLVAGEALDAPRVVAGDPSFELHVVALDAVRGRRPGLVVLGRITAPLRADAVSAGWPDVSWEAGLGVDGIVGRSWLGLNLGWRGVPRTELGERLVDDGLFFRAGGAVGLTPSWDLALEAAGFVPVLAAPSARTAPVDALLTASWRAPAGLWVRFGGGAGLTPALGVPRARVVLSFGWGHRPALGTDDAADVPTE